MENTRPNFRRNILFSGARELSSMADLENLTVENSAGSDEAETGADEAAVVLSHLPGI